MKMFFPALALCAGLTLRFEGVGVFSHYYSPLYMYVTPAIAVAAVALVLFPGDLREKFMLGDAGSNVLGAVVGLGLVLGTSFWWRLGVLAVMLVLNVLSEKYSFSKAIASNRVLNWIDSIGRKGQEAPGANNS
jgi:UDP-N-acetylmuramyl pentapeptide phosphotransferase/UDP-N-acetylglucosamine-1-phosphate transferase